MTHIAAISETLILALASEPSHEKTCLQVCDQVRLKPACAATEVNYSVESLDILISLANNKDADQTVLKVSHTKREHFHLVCIGCIGRHATLSLG